MTASRSTTRQTHRGALTVPITSRTLSVWVPLFAALSIALCGVGCGPGSRTVACATGTYDDDGDDATACVAWTTCTAGEYVSTAGSATTDRVCTGCASGSFSAEDDAASCTAWQVCDAGFVEGVAGSSTMDRTCIPDAWTRQFGTSGTDVAEAVSLASDAGVIVAGQTSGTLPGQSSAGGTDAFVRKLDSAGEELWTRQFGSAEGDVAISADVDSDGSVLVAGYTEGALPGQSSAGTWDVFVRKYDSAGNELWTRQFGSASSEFAYSVSVGSDGSVLVAGYTNGALPGQSAAGTWDVFVRKYDSAGDALWTRQFGTGSDDRGRSVSVGSDGSVLVTGYTAGALPGQSLVGEWDVFVRKYDATGSELWTRQFGTTGSDFALSVSVGSDGSLLVAGYTSGTLPEQSSASSQDAFVRKYDSAGNELWTRQFGTAGGDYAQSVSVDSEGSALVAGYTDGAFPAYTTAGSRDAFVRRYDSAGSALWTRQFGTASGDYAQSVSVGSDGSALVAGYTDGTLPGQSSAGSSDAYVSKLAAP